MKRSLEEWILDTYFQISLKVSTAINALVAYICK